MIEDIKNNVLAYEQEAKALRFLYNTTIGRIILKPLCSRTLSKIAGAFLSSSMSKFLIEPFVRKNHIDLEDYYSDKFKCFNDCFSRKIIESKRPIEGGQEVLIAPCDGWLSAYEIRDDVVIGVKQSRYTISSLLRDENLAREFNGGLCLVFRLCVDNYHRYCYIDSGKKGENIYIPGKLHTVRPIALHAVPVFCENCREYTVIESDNFGKIVQMEVGAMLVGKIKNYHGAGDVLKGQEKGMFLYGGSTIIVLLKNGVVSINEKFIENTDAGVETPVKMGERLNKTV